jgi:hypothetical protein
MSWPRAIFNTVIAAWRFISSKKQRSMLAQAQSVQVGVAHESKFVAHDL